MEMNLPGGLGIGLIVVAMIAVFIAALIRGYAGFGFGAISVASLSLMMPPAQVIPAVLMLEVVAGLHLLPSVWRHIDWRQLVWISLGAAIATPLGLALLVSAPIDWMRLIISLLILTAALLIWSGWRLKARESAATTFAAGLISGGVNGAAGIGGLPLVVFFLSKGACVTASRATMVAYFIGLDVFTTGLASTQGLVTVEVLWLVGLFLIPLSLGSWLGNRRFNRSEPKSFRRVALSLLVLLAGSGLVRALV